MKRNWMAFCLAAALMTAGTVYAKPAPSQLVPEKHGQCYVEDNLFVKDVNGAGGGQGVLHGDFAFRREQALKTDAIKEINSILSMISTKAGFSQEASNLAI